MTREEAIYIISQMIKDEEGFLSDNTVEAHKMAIKALEQEPCEDAIGRSDMLDAIGHGKTYTSEELQRIIKALPPVNPQPKTGHWIFDDECKEHGHCSECGYGSVDLVGGELWNFCSNCGAKMVEP